MGLLSDIFDIDEDTEKDIKDIVKLIGIIALVVGGASAGGSILDLPLTMTRRNNICVHYLAG